ncbi:MAG: hypothetical protein OXT67_04650 [Zetaproteobacteria bacterium]|nr:hypothetical protein [Zetaproteobacteria bacterium]
MRRNKALVPAYSPESVTQPQSLSPTPLRRETFTITPTRFGAHNFLWLQASQPEPGLIYIFEVCGHSQGTSWCFSKESLQGSVLIPPVFRTNKRVTLRSCAPRQLLSQPRLCSLVEEREYVYQDPDYQPQMAQLWQSVENIQTQMSQKIVGLYVAHQEKLDQELREFSQTRPENYPRVHALGPDFAPLLYHIYLLSRAPDLLSQEEAENLPPEEMEAEESATVQKDANTSDASPDPEEEKIDYAGFAGQYMSIIGMITVSFSAVGLATSKVIAKSVQKIIDENSHTLKESIYSKLEIELRSKDLEVGDVLKAFQAGLDKVEQLSAEQTLKLKKYAEELTRSLSQATEKAALGSVKALELVDSAERMLLTWNDEQLRQRIFQPFNSEYAFEWGKIEPHFFENEEVFTRSVFRSRDASVLTLRYDDKNGVAPFSQALKAAKLYTAAQAESYDQFHSALRVTAAGELARLQEQSSNFKPLVISPISGEKVNLGIIGDQAYLLDQGNYYKLQRWIEVSTDTRNIYRGGNRKPLMKHNKIFVLSTNSRQELMRKYDVAKRKLYEAESRMQNLPLAEYRQRMAEAVQEFELWGKGLVLQGESEGQKVLIEPPDIWKTTENWDAHPLNQGESPAVVRTHDNPMLNPRSKGWLEYLSDLRKSGPVAGVILQRATKRIGTTANWYALAQKQSLSSQVMLLEGELRNKSGLQDSVATEDLRAKYIAEGALRGVYESLDTLKSDLDKSVSQKISQGKDSGAILTLDKGLTNKRQVPFQYPKTNQKFYMGMGVGTVLIGAGATLTLFGEDAYQLADSPSHLSTLEKEIIQLHIQRLAILFRLLEISAPFHIPEWFYLL